ncbi:MAG: C-GCAxxG-C-C family protein [Anaerovoracaceae bacterium]|nr:C-GCAxxG-C-C family protein [Anaerovoracaceae bacterium]
MGMMDINEKIIDLKLQGNCCSQIIMQMGMDAMGKEKNPDLIAAMAGLCGGLHRGKVCGILTAAACLLYMRNPEEAGQGQNEELLDWFEDEFGSLDCDELLEGNPLNKAEKCPAMMDATYKKLQEMLGWEDD